MTLINARCVAARLKLDCIVARAVFNATLAMGWPTDKSWQAVIDVDQRYRTESPLFVEKIIVLGNVVCDMYDDHPGHTFYSSESARYFDVIAMPLASALRQALKIFHTLRADIEGEEEYAGQFLAHSIILKDQFGEALGQYKNRKWVTPVAMAEWNGLKHNSTKADDDAAYEGGWDNFSTTQGLRTHAGDLLRLLEISQSHYSGRIATTLHTGTGYLST